jgi:hypothetical protein
MGDGFSIRLPPDRRWGAMEDLLRAERHLLGNPDRPSIPRGVPTLPPLPSLMEPLPVLQADPPKRKLKAKTRPAA